MKGWLVAAAVLVLGACGKETKGTEDAAPQPEEAPPPTRFEAEIAPILLKSCAGCHTPGAKHVVFVGDEASLRAEGEKIVTRITSDNPKLVMPPPRYREPLSPEERDRLVTFLRAP